MSCILHEYLSHNVIRSRRDNITKTTQLINSHEKEVLHSFLHLPIAKSMMIKWLSDF